MIGALTILALAISNAVHQRHEVSAKPRRHCLPQASGDGRNFFLKELERPQPNLRDSWYPWLLAFGLGQSKLTSGPATTRPQRRALPHRTTARAAVRRAHLRRTPDRRRAGGEVAGSREARAQAGLGLQRRQVWRLESQRRVQAVPVEVRAVPAVDRPVAAEAGDGRRAATRVQL